jgi:hypothetical protein
MQMMPAIVATWLLLRAGSGSLAAAWAGFLGAGARAARSAALLGAAEALQIGEHVPRGLIALLQVGGHGLEDDLLQPLRDVGVQLARRHGIAVDVLYRYLLGRLAGIGQLPGEHLVHDDAQRIYVAPGVGHRALGLLRRHIVHGAHGLVGIAGQAALQLRDAEISHLDGAVLQQHDVLGLDVAVDYAPLMGVGQGLGDLRGKMQRLLPAQRALLLHVLLEGDAVHQLHHDVFHAVAVPHVVYGYDVGVGEHGNGLRLGLEALLRLVVGGQIVPQYLDGVVAVQPVAQRLVYDGHAAVADTLQNLVAVVEHHADIFIVGSIFHIYLRLRPDGQGRYIVRRIKVERKLDKGAAEAFGLRDFPGTPPAAGLVV